MMADVTEQPLPKWYSPGGPCTAVGQKDVTAMTTLNSRAGLKRVARTHARTHLEGVFHLLRIQLVPLFEHPGY